jgi:hypothetical protein
VVRQLVAEATWQAIRRSPAVRAYFERVRRDDPQRKKIALVATAHYLVRVMWALLTHGTTWEEGLVSADEPKGWLSPTGPSSLRLWNRIGRKNAKYVSGSILS